MAVDPSKWVAEFKSAIKTRNKRGILRAGYGLYLGGWYTLSSRKPFGQNIFSKDWDALIILDACRTDAMTEVAPEYDFIPEVSSTWSVGSSSPEWTINTFDEKWINKIEKTGYITANGYSKRILGDRFFPPDHNTVPFSFPNWSVISEDELLFIDHCWQYGHDEELGNVDPEYVTNSAIYHYQEYNPEKMIVHYQQPHTPYMARAKKENRELAEVEQNPLVKLKQGYDRQEIWDLYKDNLRLALNEVKVLLNNIDYDTVVITADHGDAFGEFGFYGHLGGFLHPSVRKVPWIETGSLNTLPEEKSQRNVTPPPSESDNISNEEQLRKLGYLV